MSTATPKPSEPRPTPDAGLRDGPFESTEARLHAEAAIRALDQLDEMGDEEEQKETLRLLLKHLGEDPISIRHWTS